MSATATTLNNGAQNHRPVTAVKPSDFTIAIEVAGIYLTIEQSAQLRKFLKENYIIIQRNILSQSTTTAPTPTANSVYSSQPQWTRHTATTKSSTSIGQTIVPADYNPHGPPKLVNVAFRMEHTHEDFTELYPAADLRQYSNRGAQITEKINDKNKEDHRDNNPRRYSLRSVTSLDSPIKTQVLRGRPVIASVKKKKLTSATHAGDGNISPSMSLYRNRSPSGSSAPQSHEEDAKKCSQDSVTSDQPTQEDQIFSQEIVSQETVATEVLVSSLPSPRSSLGKHPRVKSAGDENEHRRKRSRTSY